MANKLRSMPSSQSPAPERSGGWGAIPQGLADLIFDIALVGEVRSVRLTKVTKVGGRVDAWVM